MIWAASDFAFWFIEKITNTTFAHYYAGWFAVLVTTFALMFGWYLDNKVWQTDYELTTDKNVFDTKIAMFAD